MLGGSRGRGRSLAASTSRTDGLSGVCSSAVGRARSKARKMVEPSEPALRLRGLPGWGQGQGWVSELGLGLS